MLFADHIILMLFICLAIAGWFCYFRLRKQHTRKEADLVAALKELKDYKNRSYQVELESRDFSLNPHLFKNTLNAVQSYAFKTHLALDRLGGVLDYILYDSKTSFISLEEELTFILNFIELNKFRLNPLFEFNTTIQVDKNDSLYKNKLIIPLITVDFIENAFRHGDLNSHEGFISVNLQLKEGKFTYTVSNRINPNPVSSAVKGGLGQKNLRERLELMYNKDFELTYHQDKQLYKSILKLNLYEIDYKMHITG